MLDLMRTVVKSLQQADDAIDVDVMTHDQLLQHIKGFMLDPAQFTAGSLRQHVVAWEFLFDSYGHSAKSRQVMDWIKHGVHLDFVSPCSEAQRKHPKFSSRLHVVEQLLLATVDKCDVPSMLNRTSSAQVQFANRVSCDSHAAFVRDTLQGLSTVGLLAPWQSARPPTVINGLDVVKNCKGKKRLVLDCRCVNAFVRYVYFTYEQLCDFTEYMQVHVRLSLLSLLPSCAHAS